MNSHRRVLGRATLPSVALLVLSLTAAACSSDKKTTATTAVATATTAATATTTAETTAESTAASGDTTETTTGETTDATTESTGDTTDSTTEATEGTTEGTTEATTATTEALEFTAADGDVRGFDGTTIKVAGIGIKSQLPGVETGVKARVKRFNDSNEVPGVQIDYTEFIDDKMDSAFALSEIRRLVTDVQVFALVGDVSRVNPADYMIEQHVPYFGWGFDNSYCSLEPNPETWAFGYNGCLVPAAPETMPDPTTRLIKYVREVTGKDAPTIALISGDNPSGKDTVKFQSSAFAGAGFNVIFHEGSIPPPPVSDYTPYVQEMLVSDDGHAPDMIFCLAAVDCIPIYALLTASGFTGVYLHNIYSDALLAPMKGSVVSIPYHALNEDTPGIAALKADVAALDPAAVIDSGVATGYMTADMFIQALTTVAAEGTEYITPENVRLAAAHQTWQIEGFAGPTKYPDSTVSATPYCSSYALDTGDEWKTVVPFDCSEHKWPILDEFND
jgi:hypothetical protein